MYISVRGIRYYIQMWNEKAENTVVLLHGFTGSVSTWGQIASLLPSSLKIIAIDLIGHGKTDAPKDWVRYSMAEQVEDLEVIFKHLRLNSFTLVGYSMGGRTALSYVNSYPKRVVSLILESASPGLKTEDEKASRRTSDETLASKIELNGIVSFVNAWENIALFETQKRLPTSVQQAIRSERMSQREIGLANSLRGMGTGAQSSIWNELHQIKTPVYLITGELDQKFTNIAEEMKKLLPNASHFNINGVGHAIHVENSKQFATIIKEIIITTRGLING